MCESESKLSQRKLDRSMRLLITYRMNMHLGDAIVRNMIVADIERFTMMGAASYADDLRAALVEFDDWAS